MKDLSKKIFILFGMCLLTALFIACPNNAQNGGQGGGIILRKIRIFTLSLSHWMDKFAMKEKKF